MDLLCLLCLAYVRELVYGEESVVRRSVGVPGNRKLRVAIRPYMLSFPSRIATSVSRRCRAHTRITASSLAASDSMPVPNFQSGILPPIGLASWKKKTLLCRCSSFVLFFFRKFHPKHRNLIRRSQIHHERGFEVVGKTDGYTAVPQERQRGFL